jgi:8-oxo-dGTP diphosphatase
MKNMVLGFAFDNNFINVVLIRKLRPKFQNGLLNGVGGKIENETPLNAMIREFKEETGLNIIDWKNICFMKGDDWSVEVFATINENILRAETKTDEEVEIYSVHNLCYLDRCMPNLKFLIEMSMEHLTNPKTFRRAEFIYG